MGNEVGVEVVHAAQDAGQDHRRHPIAKVWRLPKLLPAYTMSKSWISFVHRLCV